MTRTTIIDKIREYQNINDIVCEEELRPKFCTFRTYEVNCSMYDVESGICLRQPFQIIKPVINYKNDTSRYNR